MGARLGLGVERNNGATVVRLAGEIDFQTASELRECLAMITTPVVVVDLGAALAPGIFAAEGPPR